MREVETQPQLPLQILSKKLIKPAIPTPYNLRQFKISSIDQHRPPVYVHYVFFYPSNVKEEGATKFAERSKQLQVSLSKILTRFFPLAGRYVQENLIIDCNDHGVEYVEAKVASHLVPALLDKDRDSKQLHHLIPHQYESPTSPLVAVQCNMFECGGQAIGLCISHRIVDAFVLTKFIDGWATARREGIEEVNQLSFDLAVVLPTKEMIREIKPVASPVIPNLKFASKTFVFSRLALSKLRKIAKDGCDKDSGKLACEPSRVQLVTALIWKALIIMDQAKHGQLRPSVILHRINMRGRTVLPISDDCFGNFARIVMLGFTPDQSNKVEFHELVSLVRDKITNAITDCAKPQTGDELFMMVDKARREAAREFNRDPKQQYYMFTSTCRMSFYPDFGWGKPSRVTRLEGRSQVVIVLMDPRDGDGIEAWIHMDEHDLNLFQRDPDIIAFTSQVEQHDDHSTILRSRY